MKEAARRRREAEAQLAKGCITRQMVIMGEVDYQIRKYQSMQRKAAKQRIRAGRQ